jgi:hypothetical protein
MQQHQDQERTLSGWLRQVADADAGSGASPLVRERLLAEMREQRRTRRTAAIKMYAVAAGLVIATVVPVWQLTTTQPSSSASPRSVAATGEAEVATVFYPLAYGGVPVTQGSIVRVAMSPSAVAALGGIEPLDVPGSSADALLADVVVGEDGLARAVRFVRMLPRDRAQEPWP